MARPATPDPAIGIWKLNLGESSFVLTPAPQSSVMKVEAWEHGLRESADTIDAQGNSFQPTTTYKFDGKDYAINGSPSADTISAIRISERKAASVWKRDGKMVFTVKTISSLDGKTLIVMRTGMDAQGRRVDDLMVYERQ